MEQRTGAGAAASLLIVAGEASGDQHGAALVRALRARLPTLSVYGLGGPQMRAAGVETIADMAILSVIGLVEALHTLPACIRLAFRLLRAAAQRQTRVAVLIDAPGFNLTFAWLAKRAGLRVVYYTSPQVWAWRPGRVQKIARRVDKMLTLFPFEVPLYAAAGVDAEYVGHPLLDQLREVPTASQAAEILGLENRQPIVALLPGSRRQEIARLLPIMLTAWQQIQQRLPQAQAVLPVAPSLERAEIQAVLRQIPAPVTLVTGQSLLALRAAQFAIVASGTATLEAGLLGTPMVIIYRVHPCTAWVARRLIRLPYFGLVNIVAGRRIMPELIQETLHPQAIVDLALACLEQPAVAQRLRDDLAALHHILGAGNAAQRAAACVAAVLCASQSATVLPGA